MVSLYLYIKSLSLFLGVVGLAMVRRALLRKREMLTLAKMSRNIPISVEKRSKNYTYRARWYSRQTGEKGEKGGNMFAYREPFTNYFYPLF